MAGRRGTSRNSAVICFARTFVAPGSRRLFFPGARTLVPPLREFNGALRLWHIFGARILVRSVLWNESRLSRRKPMRERALKSFGTVVFAAIVMIWPLAGYLQKVYAARESQEERKASAEALTTTDKDQVDLAVTVYNSNIALVRDVRQIHLSAGVFPLKFEDVAASINPATVHFRSLTEAAKLNVVEQNYEYDLLDPQKLLQKYVGREVTLVRSEKDAGSTKWIETK